MSFGTFSSRFEKSGWLARFTLSLLLSSSAARAATDIADVVEKTLTGEMVTKEGAVFFQPATQSESSAHTPQPLGVGDGLRTHALSRASVEFQDLSELRMKELTRLRILGRQRPTIASGLELFSGQIYVSSRGGAISIPIRTPHVTGIPNGTEFLISVDEGAARTEITMLDGEVELTNPANPTPVHVRKGEQGIVVPGQPIEVQSILKAKNIVQWWIYYPGILDPDELDLTPAERLPLAASLVAYQAGSLPEALKEYPGYPIPPDPNSEGQRVYYAGLLLAVGAVDRATNQLRQVGSDRRLARALRIMIASVSTPMAAEPSVRSLLEPEFISGNSALTSASEWIALSYAYQSTNNLRQALTAARAAVAHSPNFGFGWARVAELEFSFARTDAARAAVKKALTLTPHNAHAYALNGFLLAAEDRVADAVSSFDEAIRLDPAMGNAWLGRGLCRIRRGDSASGRRDLRIAAILEPSRSVVRSYAGKAFADANDTRLARKELNYAKNLDAADPTPWLYSALENWQQNLLNDAVRELQQSIGLNDNRALFRSRLLLDEDRAVRSASLAKIYRDAGLNDVAVREAARAVSQNYPNYAAHLFLAESYDALRDPTRFNLRYETAWFNELLLANLLAPVGAGAFSQNISQQEYTRLFERDRVGLSSSTEYRSDGQYRELASQFGTIDSLGYSLDLDYQHNTGIRPNNGLDRLEWYSTIKYQITPQDAALLLTKYQNYHSGDNFQYFDAHAGVRTNFNFDEFQTPILLAGYHREWGPGMHTLFLGGRLINDASQSDKAQDLMIVNSISRNQTLATMSPFDVQYRTQLEIYTAELSQILEANRNTAIFGVRYQTGQFDTRSTQVSLDLPAVFTNSLTAANEDFHHVAAYVYDTVEIVDDLLLTAGVAYDALRFPRNYRQVPISAGTDSRSEVSPKAALVWSPSQEATVRTVYTKSLGGVNLDESYRLEPVQLAGFSQAFRTLIPESVAGSVSAPNFETFGLALDLKFTTQTYVGLQGDLLNSDLDRSWGVYDFDRGATASITPQRLHLEERSAAIKINQLLAEVWALGVQYSFVRDELATRWPLLDPSVNPGFDNSRASDLHFVGLSGLFNHPSGFFAGTEANWYWQQNRQTDNPTGIKATVHLPDDQFPQVNLWAGYRLARRRGDLAVGLLNLTGDDYHLNPLNLYMELPHERVVAARVRLRF